MTGLHIQSPLTPHHFPPKTTCFNYYNYKLHHSYKLKKKNLKLMAKKLWTLNWNTAAELFFLFFWDYFFQSQLYLFFNYIFQYYLILKIKMHNLF